MRTIRYVLLGGAVAALLLGSQVIQAQSADTNAAPSEKASGKLGFHDSMFLRRAAEGNLIGGKIAQLAADKGSTPDLKKLGATLAETHTNGYQQLTQIAQKLGVAIPTELNARQKRVLDHFTSLSGTNFDKSVLRYLSRSEESAVRSTENQSTKGTNPTLKQYATDTLPALRSDLQQVRTLYAGNGATHEPAGAQPGQQNQPTTTTPKDNQ